MSAADFRDYLVQEGQRQQVMQRATENMRDPEREATDVEQVVESAARNQISALGETADRLDDGYVEMVTEVRDLRDSIESRSLTVDEAKKALLDLRQRHEVMRHQMGRARSSYDQALTTVKDPAARRDELIAKYGL